MDQILGLPAGTPPSGVVSNLAEPNPFHALAIATIVVIEVVATSAMIMRLFTQIFILRGLLIEDYAIILAWIFKIGVDSTSVLATSHGVGKHIWNVSIGSAIDILKIVYAYEILYAFCIIFIKVPILLQFIRLFAPPGARNKPMRYACWAIIILNTVFYIINVFTLVFRCTPIKKAWNLFAEGHCLNMAVIYESSAVFNVITDFSILVIPLPVILRLKMHTTKKLAIATIFATGLIACAASVVRLYYVWRTFSTTDMTYPLFWQGWWCVLEICCGIVIFCLPVAPIFYQFVRGRMRRSRSQTVVPPSHTPSAEAERGSERVTRRVYQDVSLASFEQKSSSSPETKWVPSLDSSRLETGHESSVELSWASRQRYDDTRYM